MCYIGFNSDISRIRVCIARAIKKLFLGIMACLSISANAQIQFQNTTISVGGPYHTGESWGAAWGHMDGDVYPDLFVNNHAMLPSLLRNNADGTFTDNILIADLEQIWVAEPTSDLHGGAWADFDNDGDQDLFVTRSSIGARFQLFENNGQGYFEEKGGEFGIGPNGGGRMPVLFDYNKDGRLDVMLARNGGEGKIFKWDVNKFIEQTAETGLSWQCNTTYGGFASDLFDSGDVDFICLAETSFPYGTYSTATIPFTNISSSFDSIGTNSDTVLADFNNDLKMDLFATRGAVRPSGVKRTSDDRIEAWLRVGGMTNFEKSITFSSTGPITLSIYARNVSDPNEVLIGSSAYNPSSLPVTLDPADPNNWGVIANHDQYAVYVEYDEVVEEWTISLSTGGSGSEGAYFVIDGTSFSEPTVTGLNAIDLPIPPKFLINNGTSLVDSNSRGIGSIMCGGIAAADFDNDMDVDLFLTCRTSIENLENRLYLNDGTGHFSLDTSSNGVQGLLGAGIDSGKGTSENVVFADYDIDGFVDLFVTNGNRLFPHFVQDGFSAGGPDQFHRNLGGNGNHWLQFDLQGVNSNRDGFGAKVIVTAGSVSQLREQNGSHHRWSHDHKRLHFGLASNTTADVTVEWPDGTSDVYTSVAADKLYRAVQGSSSLVDITPDLSKPTLSVDNVSVSEGGSAILTVSLSGTSPTPISVDYETIANTALENLDFVPTSGTLNFGLNETTKTVTINTLTNPELEANEIFVLSLFNSGDTLITQSSGIVTIEEEGGRACGQPDYTIQSDKGLFVWRDCGNTDNWIFRGTAGGGSQTVYLGDLTASDVISSLATYSFEGSDFAVLSNSDERLDFKLTMSNSGEDGFEFALPYGQELCLTLNDPSLDIFVGAEKVPFNSNVNLASVSALCQPKLSISDITVSEAIGNVDVTVSMSNAYNDVVSASFTTSDGSAIAGFDYSSVTGSVDIAVNSTSSVITIPILQDTEVESLEIFSVTLSNPVNASILDSDAIVSIDDDELTACGEPSYSPSSDAGIFVWQECDGSGQWYVRTTAGGGGETYLGSFTASNSISSLVPFSFESSDYATLIASNKIIDFGMSMVNAGQDGLDFIVPEGSELCLTIDDPNQIIYVGVDETQFTSVVNLIDVTGTCAAGLPTLSIADVTISEAAGSVDVTVTMSAISSNVVSLDYVTSDGSATSGADYASVSGTLDIQPNDISAVINVPILQDTDVEPLEDFAVTISNSVNADVLVNSAIVSIDDDELTACGEPSISPSTEAGLFVWQDCSNDEWFIRTTAGGGSAVEYIGSLTSDIAIGPVTTFSFEGVDSYSLSNSDKELSYLMRMSGVGVDGLDIDLTSVSELCLSLDDPNQVIYVGEDKIPFLSTVNLINIGDACVQGLPTLSIADVTISEAAGSVDVTVTMSAISSNVVSATFSTSDGSATNGFDYLSTSGTVTIQPNDTDAIISIPVLQDTDVENLEDFIVTLNNPVNADILTGSATVSIEDDEVNTCGQPTYSPSIDDGIFIWQDCGGTNQWYVRATAGGGSAITYTGSLLSDFSITSVTTFSFEGVDSYTLSNSDQNLNFLMKMSGNGEDGIQFSLTPGSSCFDVDLPVNTVVTVGVDNAILTPPFDLFTLGNCQ